MLYIYRGSVFFNEIEIAKFMIIENMWINNTILVVEDEDANFQLIKYCLKKTGANLKWAKNGEESLYLLNKDNDIDLVLMDIRMPLMDGIKATKIIRQNKMDLPVIMHSSFESDYYEICYWASGSMSWSDVHGYAVEIEKSEEVDYEDGWRNGGYDIID